MIVADGIYYALGLTAGGLLVSYLAHPWFGLPLYILAAFCLYFFRDPERAIPAGPVAVSPADGKVDRKSTRPELQSPRSPLFPYTTLFRSGLPLSILAAFCLYFFRDPERAIPAGPVAVSPADGK